MAILAAPVRQMTGARPASRGVNYPLLGLALIILAVARVFHIYREMDKREQKVPYGSEGCTLYRDVMSPEDIIPVYDGVYLASSEERRKHMMQSIGAEATPWGHLYAIWNVDTPGEDPKTALLELEGFPEGIAFRPHGMHYRQETNELFVINHAYSQGGERIDVFKVSEAFPQDPLPLIHASLLEGTPKPSSAEVDRETRPEETNSTDTVPSDPNHLGKVDDDAAPADGTGPPEREQEDVNPDTATASDESNQSQSVEEKASAKSQDGEAEVEANVEAVEEVAEETPKEKAKRVKREAKEAAAKAKAEARKVLAEEKAAAKAEAAKLAARAKGLSRAQTPVTLTYSFSVEHDIIKNNYGALNDLVLVDDDELYVTQTLAMPQPLHGPTQPDSLVERLRIYGSIAATMLHMTKSPIIRCTGIRGDGVSCERLVKGRGVLYNGIALSPNKERLLVSDTMAMQMVVFNRSVETGALQLQQRLNLPASPDNLEIDIFRAAEGIEAYTMGLTSSMQYFAYSAAMEGAKEATDGDHVKIPGGMSSITFDKTFGNYTNSLEMWLDGDLLAISSATAIKSDSRLLGSAVGEGFLLCRPPKSCTSEAEGTNCGTKWGPPPVEEEEQTASD